MKENNEFLEFQSEFKKWQTRFGLTGYQVYFKYEPINDSFAEIQVNQGHMVATVRLNSRLSAKDKAHKDIRQDAKHEALHLLLRRLATRAEERFISPDQVYEATEELVNKLLDLIKDD